jgi:hypothetical protein
VTSPPLSLNVWIRPGNKLFLLLWSAPSMDRKECINCEKARVVRLGRFQCSSTCNGLKVRALFFLLLFEQAFVY